MSGQPPPGTSVQRVLPAAAALSTASSVRYIHSDIFDRLVTSPKDLEGLVAYGYYQQRKRQWMNVLDKQGRQPTEDELKAFALSFQDDALASLKDEAAGTLFRFSESVMQSRMQVMTEDAFNQRAITELSSLKSSIGHISGYKHHIVGHVVGFVVLLFLTFIFSVAITREPHLAALVSSLYAKPEAASQPH